MCGVCLSGCFSGEKRLPGGRPTLRSLYFCFRLAFGKVSLENGPSIARRRGRSTGTMRRRVIPTLVVAAWIAGTILARAQQLPQPLPDPANDLQGTYARLLAAINKIPIFDNHGHPGFADDA